MFVNNKSMILHLERKFTSPTETFIVNQINAVNTMKHNVFTVENLNFLKVKATVYNPPKSPAFSTKFLKKNHYKYFEAILKKQTPKIIHSHYLTDAAFFHPLTKNLNIPKVCSCYGYDVSVIPRKFGLLAKYYYKKVFKEYDLFLAMTDEMKNDLLAIGCPKSKLMVHYHGIDTYFFDLQREYELKNGVFNILTIASLYPVKGHLSVLKAVKLFSKKNPEIEVRYTIVGNGILKEKLEDFVKKNKLAEKIIFQPGIKHGPEFINFLNEADVFLHPSITTKENDKEGIPGAIVEAMASGLPVISTQHGGIPFIIENNKTGFLVKEHDSSSIAQYLELLYNNKDLRIKIGRNANKYAKSKLDLFEKAKDLKEIYNSLIAKNAKYINS